MALTLYAMKEEFHMNACDFQEKYPQLVHFSPATTFAEKSIEHGLLTASQIIDLHSDPSGNISARFVADQNYVTYNKEYWKTHSRFKRGAGDSGSNILIRHKTDVDQFSILGNNLPLGDGSCIGTTLPLSDNLHGDEAPSREDWFRILNSMFWVFDSRQINAGFIDHIRNSDQNSRVVKIIINTRSLSDEFIEHNIRLSSINGGGSNGAFPRGTATYKKPSQWTSHKTPIEIGILDGIPKRIISSLDIRIEIVA